MLNKPIKEKDLKKCINDVFFNKKNTDNKVDYINKKPTQKELNTKFKIKGK